MQQKLFKSEVVENNKLNYKFQLVKLKLIERTFLFNPGQFITLKVTNSIYRCYSLFSLPTLVPYWEMFVDISPGGPGTTYIRNLKIKDVIETLGPSGTFTCEKNSNKNYIFAATGCGLAPLKTMIENLLNSPDHPKIFLFWGLRDKKDIVLQDVLNNWTKDYPHFHYEIILSQPTEKWKGKKGHVNSHILNLVKQLPADKTSVYLSGNSEFINDNLKNLSNIKYLTDNIYYESYY